ncbi:MAG: hypothetical protein HQ534_10835 [Armatimonadetes bacterium]|nr:hypothetical protein [Armatimonadota bacterium]
MKISILMTLIIAAMLLIGAEVCQAQTNFAKAYTGESLDFCYDIGLTDDGGIIASGKKNH